MPTSNLYRSPVPNPKPHYDRLLTYADLERWLGLTERTLRRRVKDGSLRSIRIGGAIRFRREDVKAFIRDNASKES